jgi:hypothetical protein
MVQVFQAFDAVFDTAFAADGPVSAIAGAYAYRFMYAEKRPEFLCAAAGTFREKVRYI